jgi:hypothetical protein
MPRTPRALRQAAEEAARRLREANAALDAAPPPTRAGARAAVDKARADFEAANRALIDSTGTQVDEQGRLLPFARNELALRGAIRSEPTAAQEARAALRDAGIADDDLTDEEAGAKAAELGAAARDRTLRDLFRSRVGREPEELTDAGRRAVIEGEVLEQSGVADRLRSGRKVIGSDDVADRLRRIAEDPDQDSAAAALREVAGDVTDALDQDAYDQLVAERLGKAAGSLTPADRAEFERQVERQAIEALTGTPIGELSALELAKARSTLRNDAYFARLRSGSGSGASGSGTATTPSAGGTTASGTHTGDDPLGTGGPGGTPSAGAGTTPPGGTGTPSGPGGTDGGTQPAGSGSTGPAPGTGHGSAGTTPPPSGGGGSPGPGPATDAGGGTSGPTGGASHDVWFSVAVGRVDADPGSPSFGDGTMMTFHRTADGRWFDEAGHEVTDAANVATLEAQYQEYLEQGGTAGPTGQTVTESDTTFEQAVEQSRTENRQNDSDSTAGSGSGSGSDTQSAGGSDDEDADDDGGGDGSDGDAGAAGSDGGDSGSEGQDSGEVESTPVGPDGEGHRGLGWWLSQRGAVIERIGPRLSTGGDRATAGTPAPDGAAPDPSPLAGIVAELDSPAIRPGVDNPCGVEAGPRAGVPSGDFGHDRGVIDPGPDGSGAADPPGPEQDPFARLGHAGSPPPTRTGAGAEEPDDADDDPDGGVGGLDLRFGTGARRPSFDPGGDPARAALSGVSPLDPGPDPTTGWDPATERAFDPTLFRPPLRPAGLDTPRPGSVADEDDDDD